MNRWRRYGWLGLILLTVAACFWAWRRSLPPPMPAIPPGANARTEDAPDH